MLRASDLKALPIVSDVGGQTGYRAVYPMLDIRLMVVTHTLIRVDQNDQVSPAYQLPISQIDRVDSQGIRVTEFNAGSLLPAEHGQATKSAICVNLFEMKVISRKGNYLGVVYDYYFHKQSGQLSIFSVLREGEETFFSCEDDFKIGEDIIISDLSKRIKPPEVDKPIAKPVLKDKPAPASLPSLDHEITMPMDGQTALPEKETQAKDQKAEPMQAEEIVGQGQEPEAEMLASDKIRLSASAKNLLRHYLEE